MRSDLYYISVYIYYKTVIVKVNKYLFSVPPHPLKKERESASTLVLEVVKLFTPINKDKLFFFMFY